ncbi:DUF3562 domain-containing protein [Cupriavidus necator]|uniref:DUF3562 domain-containing protein n=1 Tax=Cupriavidus necator TaxID=106590 RepID=A0A1U9UIZ4_CUPNE|nr:DUF3562 domain-containing protein [Cupriavidus necator]AQV92558.1 DUF3562 domain-containing protein [Cupriavidus necator]
MRTEDQDHVVARIAADTGFPPEVVRESYLAAFAELSADARVHAYLPLFAAKRVIARLRNANAESATQTHSSNLDAARDEVLSGTQVAFPASPDDCSHLRPRQTRQRQSAALA